MFLVNDTSKLKNFETACFRLSTKSFLCLPLSREARKELETVSTEEVDTVSWMSPYGDILALNEVDYGVYSLTVNNEPIGARLRADDITKLVYTIESGRPMLAVRKFKRLPTTKDIEFPIRIGFLYKEPESAQYALVSAGRVQPTQVADMLKFNWAFPTCLEIKAGADTIKIQPYTGLGQSPVLLNNDPATISDVIAELEALDVTVYELRDLRSS